MRSTMLVGSHVLRAPENLVSYLRLTGRRAAALAIALLLFAWVGVRPAQAADSPPSAGGSKQQYQAGLEHFRAGRLKEAMATFKPAAAESSGYLKLCATNMVGQTARLDGDSKAALAAFKSMAMQADAISRERAGTQVGKRAEVLRQLAIVYQAEIFEEQGKWAPAVKQYESLMNDREIVEGGPAVLRNPASYERIARLYWRVGQRPKALEMFEKLLNTWPNYPRGPLISLSMLAVQAGSSESGIGESRLGFLCLPLRGTIIPPAAGVANANSMSSAACAIDPSVLKPMREIMSRPGIDPGWAAYIHSLCGWMFFQLGRLDEAVAEFQTAGPAGASLQVPSFWVYCELGVSLVYNRQRRWNESLSLAQEMEQAAGGDHAKLFASQLAGADQKIVHDDKSETQPAADAEGATTKPADDVTTTMPATAPGI